MTDIEALSITGLFGRFDVDLRLRDNRLVLVGENGTGKSTIIGILYDLLTAQWQSLIDKPFERLEFEINGNRHALERSDLRASVASESRGFDHGVLRYLRSRMGRGALAEFTTRVRHLPPLDDGELVEWADDLAKRYDIPSGAARDYLLFSRDRAGATGPQPVLAELEGLVGPAVSEQILFLPTYRRIEADLGHIFPNLDPDKGLREYDRRRHRRDGFIELVEFGMNDVETGVAEKMRSLDQDFRADLNKLTGQYLRDVIRGQHKQAKMDVLMSDSAQRTAEDVLGRIDDQILPATDRDKLRDFLSEIQTSGKIAGEQRVIAHFLTRLFEIHRAQQEREAPMRQLMSICNEYLTGKQLVFDSQNFAAALVLEDGETQIRLSDLSSGEKQIVSLFAHMFLSKSSSHIVLIDEPELSISVPWQRRFLPDIWRTGLCSALIAVTHSPFIFENEFRDHVDVLERVERSTT